MLMLLLVFVISLYGQKKYEKESRLNQADVPVNAIQFIAALKTSSKIKWYFEEGIYENSVEAKFRWKGKKYSIEFDTLGNIQDVEVLMKWGEITDFVRNQINSQLDSTYTRYKIRKIQCQYIGNQTALLPFLKKEKYTQSVLTNYELIVKGKKKNSTKLYEILFDKKGKILRINEIIFKNSDNLEY